MPKVIILGFILLTLLVSCDGKNFDILDVKVDPEIDTVYVQALSATLSDLILDFKDINRQDTFSVFTLYCTDYINNDIGFIVSNNKTHQPFSIGAE